MQLVISATSLTAWSLCEKLGMQATLALINRKPTMQWDTQPPPTQFNFIGVKLVVGFAIILV